jgi:hypothetical protein
MTSLVSIMAYPKKLAVSICWKPPKLDGAAAI